jgi:hypothetical protein
MNDVKFKIETDGHPSSLRLFRPRIYSQRERVLRGLKTFFIFFLAAVVSVVIPVLHFVLVPTFLIAAFVMGYLKFKDVGSIDLSNFTCPECQKNLNEKILAFKDKDFSGRLRCYDCRKNIYISILN